VRQPQGFEQRAVACVALRDRRELPGAPRQTRPDGHFGRRPAPANFCRHLGAVRCKLRTTTVARTARQKMNLNSEKQTNPKNA